MAEANQDFSAFLSDLMVGLSATCKSFPDAEALNQFQSFELAPITRSISKRASLPVNFDNVTLKRSMPLQVLSKTDSNDWTKVPDSRLPDKRATISFTMMSLAGTVNLKKYLEVLAESDEENTKPTFEPKVEVKKAFKSRSKDSGFSEATSSDCKPYPQASYLEAMFRSPPREIQKTSREGKRLSLLTPKLSIALPERRSSLNVLQALKAVTLPTQKAPKRLESLQLVLPIVQSGFLGEDDRAPPISPLQPAHSCRTVSAPSLRPLFAFKGAPLSMKSYLSINNHKAVIEDERGSPVSAPPALKSAIASKRESIICLSPAQYATFAVAETICIKTPVSLYSSEPFMSLDSFTTPEHRAYKPLPALSYISAPQLVNASKTLINTIPIRQLLSEKGLEWQGDDDSGNYSHAALPKRSLFIKFKAWLHRITA